MNLYIKNSFLIIGLVLCMSVIYYFHIRKVNSIDSIRKKYSLITYYSYGLILMFMLFTLAFAVLEKVASLRSSDGNITNFQGMLIAVLTVCLAVLLDIKIKSPLREHFICPNCLKNISIIQDWQCPYCDSMNEQMSIVAKCKNCKDILPGFVCPYCQEEIGFDDSYNEKELKRRRNHEQV